MCQQSQVSKRKEAEIQRRRAMARKKIEILNELKSSELQPHDAPLICVLPTPRHSKKSRMMPLDVFPSHRCTKYQRRLAREQRWAEKAKRNPLLQEVINAP